ncbi:MAG: dephospho-CoA kinase, partial [Ilumatobacteraceae bacterium]
EARLAFRSALAHFELGVGRSVVMDIGGGSLELALAAEGLVERLVSFRGFTEDDARARIARQATRDERLAGADFVIDNSGAPEDLAEQIDRLWTWLNELPQLPADYEPILPTQRPPKT